MFLLPRPRPLFITLSILATCTYAISLYYALTSTRPLAAYAITLTYLYTIAVLAATAGILLVMKHVLLFILNIFVRAIRGPLIILKMFPILNGIAEAVMMIYFYLCFKLLLASDRFIRLVLRSMSQSLRHPSGSLYSLTNATDPNFQPLASFSDAPSRNSLPLPLKYPPHYSEQTAISLCQMSRLIYEDFRLISWELKEAQFEEIRTVHYRNTVGIVTKKGRRIICAFRGTDPVNIMSMYTDSQLGMVSLDALDHMDERGASKGAPKVSSELEGQSMGKVHFGFVEALRVGKKNNKVEPPPAVLPNGEEEGQHTDGATIKLSSNSMSGSLLSALKGVFEILRFTWSSVKLHSSDPIDSSFTGKHERNITAYQQAAGAIDAMWVENSGMEVLITGHSMGAALALVFLAQAAHERKEWVADSALYTYGCPRVGDATFCLHMKSMRNHIFHIINNNDVVARVPWKRQEVGKWIPNFMVREGGGIYEAYSDNPGIRIFIDGASGRVSIDPTSVRGISFTKPSGILNPAVLLRMKDENLLRICFRLLLPFFLNDHFGSDYAMMLKVHRALRLATGRMSKSIRED